MQQPLRTRPQLHRRSDGQRSGRRENWHGLQPYRSRCLHRKGSAKPLRSRKPEHAPGIRPASPHHRKSLHADLRNSAPQLPPRASGESKVRRNHDECVRVRRLIFFQSRNDPIAQSRNEPTMKASTESPTLTSASFEDLVQEMIVRLGEDPNREGLQQTPQRVRKSLQFLTRGYTERSEE